jgi:hypothetical protein
VWNRLSCPNCDRALRDGKTAPGAVVEAIEMIEYQKEAILISFLKEKERYKKLAEYIVHLIRDDPSSPKDSLHGRKKTGSMSKILSTA